MRHSEFFDLSGFAHAALFQSALNVWEVLGGIKKYAAAAKHNVPDVPASGVRLMETVVIHEGKFYTDDIEITHEAAAKGELAVKRGGKILEGASVIFAGAVLAGSPINIGKGSVVESGAWLGRRVIIGDRCEVRQSAYVRGDVVTGAGCVIGHATEVKNSIFLDGAKAGHFAYVGDSILGRGVNLGAGTKLANLKIIPGNVEINISGVRVNTGRRKLGAIIGDGGETGCNSVTSPGTLLGRESILYPNMAAPPGYYHAHTVISPSKDAIVIRTRKKK
jgi:bifunctional N-acetylglucosamine-1-phosphate-uridyltransferase/glucosamine-1-phosphate-acetyltransferase GlmU-like protein